MRRKVKYYDNHRALPDQYGWCLALTGGMYDPPYALVERPDGKIDKVFIDDDFMFIDQDDFKNE